jgi:EVE domain
MTDTFQPWRRNIDFKLCQETPIRPLLDKLRFIKDKQHWGYPFRVGLFEIEKEDFDTILQAMNITN